MEAETITPMSGLLAFFVLLPFVGAFAPLLVGRRAPHLAGWVALAVAVSVFSGFLFLASAHHPGGEPLTFTREWIPSLGLSLALWAPGFSLFFALLVAGIGVLVVTYAIGYMKGDERQPRFFSFLLFFMGAMVGMACSADLLLLFAFWELTSISSFLLIGYFHELEKGRKGAQAAFVLTGMGALCMLAGIILLGLEMQRLNLLLDWGLARTELLRFDVLYSYAAQLAEYGAGLNAIMLLLFMGAFTKSAQAPFHIWLPGAMEAPTPVSTYLHSATMVKAGLFLIARLIPVFSIVPDGSWFAVLGHVGLLTFVMGAVLAYFADDIKGVLAYTTVSQLGFITACYGHAAVLGTYTDIYHILNHAAYKAPLFMVAGILSHALHTRSVRKMVSTPGLGRAMPITAAIAVLAALAMAGLPPTSGFVSKEIFLKSMVTLAGMGIYTPLEPILALVGAAFVVAVALRLTHGIFFCNPKGSSLSYRPLEEELHGEDRLHFRDEHGGALHDPSDDPDPGHAPHDPSPFLWLPPLLLALLPIAGFFLPHQAEHLVAHLQEEGTLHRPIDSAAHPFAWWHGFNLPLVMTLIAIGAGVWLYLQHGRFASAWLPGRTETWRPALRRLMHYRPSRLFARFSDALPDMAGALTRSYVRGDLPLYLLIYFLFLASLVVATVAAGFGLGNAMAWERLFVGLISPGPMAIFAALAISVFGVLWVRQRLAMVLIASITGYLCCLFYVLYRAPDLALTQLLVETVSTVLFLLTFRLLPTFRQQDAIAPAVRRTTEKAVAGAIGLAAFLVTWMAIQNPQAPSIAPFYLFNTVVGAGGKNAVNTVIVDFRGYDTLGEITVLCIALLGVSVLLSRRIPKLVAGAQRGAATSTLPQFASGLVQAHESMTGVPAVAQGDTPPANAEART